MRQLPGARKQRKEGFQSTHSAGNATMLDDDLKRLIKISIHAFRRECDIKLTIKPDFILYFNPRIPQGMRPPQHISCGFHRYFNPRIPQGMRPEELNRLRDEHIFQSTHSAGNATKVLTQPAIDLKFQSTHSAGNATDIEGAVAAVLAISIHAFRRECDMPET